MAPAGVGSFRPSSRPARRSVLLGTAGAVAAFGALGGRAVAATASPTPPEERTGPRAQAWIRRVVARMSVEEEVGRPLVTHVYGAAADSPDALGINQDYAPDADVNVDPGNPVIGVRSFGSDPGLVAELATAQVRDYQRDGGIAATAKHFPGHGDTKVDSHTGIPEIRHTRQEWERLDAPPFRAVIEAGIDSIMTGHLVFPALDPSGDPATLSRPIVTGLLREELGFTGLVVTDALGMKGVRDKYGDGQVVILAINAGVDMLLRPPAFDPAHRQGLGHRRHRPADPAATAGRRTPRHRAAGRGGRGRRPLRPGVRRPRAGMLATYAPNAVTMRALARVCGEVGPRGRLPVEIPTADGAGVLYPYGHGRTW